VCDVFEKLNSNGKRTKNGILAELMIFYIGGKKLKNRTLEARALFEQASEKDLLKHVVCFFFLL